jgi:hypothetical protein
VKQNLLGNKLTTKGKMVVALDPIPTAGRGGDPTLRGATWCGSLFPLFYPLWVLWEKKKRLLFVLN